MIGPAPNSLSSSVLVGSTPSQALPPRSSEIQAWPNHETLSLDGIVYKIIVELVEGRYHTSWECLECHEISGSAFRRASIDNAVAFAKIHLMGHHNSAHRGEQD